MRARSVAAAFLLLTAFVPAACSAPTGHDLRSGSRPTVAMRTIPLADGAKLFAWTQPGRRAAPWFVYVHGGSWRRGRGDSPNAYALAAHELRRGYQVFSVDYRLSEQARWPAQRTDVAAAVDRIRSGAATFGIAADRGVIIGESAGGQLAAIEASRGRVAGLVDLAGAVDPQAALHAPHRDLGESAERLVGCPPVSCPTRWRDTRAVSGIGAAMPPALIVHSRDDPIVPVGMSRAYAAALRTADRPVTLRIVPGDSHGLLLRSSVLRMVDDFAGRVTGRG